MINLQNIDEIDLLDCGETVCNDAINLEYCLKCLEIGGGDVCKYGYLNNWHEEDEID